MILLKTREEHMQQVRRHRKHASDVQPRGIKIGDWMLIQVTQGRKGNEVRRVRYAMRLAAMPYVDEAECEELFGQAWKFIIPGKDFCVLRRGFDIDDVKVSNKNYGQGVIRFAYIEPADEAVILNDRLLECV
jgi:hypothetical protein